MRRWCADAGRRPNTASPTGVASASHPFHMEHVRCSLPAMETVLPSLEAIVVGSVALTARALADAGAELTLVQWRVLVVLHGAGEPLAIGDLARPVAASPSAMSRLIGRLTTRGYLSSHGERRDRRERRVVLSQRGRQL